MSKTRIYSKTREDRKQIAQRVTHRLALLIGFLTISLLILVFRIGEIWWPEWMIEHRTQIIGFMSFIAIFVIFLSPIMIEASSNTRTLTGPGKNPKGPRLE